MLVWQKKFLVFCFSFRSTDSIHEYESKTGVDISELGCFIKKIRSISGIKCHYNMETFEFLFRNGSSF